jgi:hypothetical protein
MERLFSPCTRYRDIAQSQGRSISPCGERHRDNGIDFEPLQELNLDVSIEEFLSADRAFAYADLYCMVENLPDTIVWLTPQTAVFCGMGLARDYFENMVDGPIYQYSFTADGVNRVKTVARSSEALSEICDVVLRLLAASFVHSLLIIKLTHEEHFINGPTLAYMMEQCPSLKILTLQQMALNEDHCRALGACSRPGLEIELKTCKLTSAGTSAFVEMLGRNQGPTKLDLCTIDNLVLANGLHGNSRLKSLRLFVYGLEDNDRQGFALADALRENKGLVDLELRHEPGEAGLMSDETWDAVCDSLKTHPTLQILNLWRIIMAPLSLTLRGLALRESRVQTLVDMMQVNRSIHTIHLQSHLYFEHNLFTGTVIPYLETNRLRPHVRAIQKTRPMAYRAKLLKRALLATRTDANSFWMILSGNAEVAFPSTTATTPPAAVAAPTAATRAVSATGASAAANVATSSDCQKRKARP